MPNQQVTLAQFRLNLQESYEGTPFWSDTEANRAINESLRWWNLLTGYWRKMETITTVANQVFYSLSSTLIMPCRVHFSSYPMDIGSIFDMNQGRPGWRGETTATSGAPSRPTIWCPVGLKRIAIWPADSVGNTTLVVDSIRTTPVLVNDTDFVDIGREELSSLGGEALHIAAFKEGGRRWQATFHFHQEFIKCALQRNGMLYASDIYRRAAGIDTGRSQHRMTRPELEAQSAQVQSNSQQSQQQ
jgi:hypothetical protein